MQIEDATKELQQRIAELEKQRDEELQKVTERYNKQIDRLKTTMAVNEDLLWIKCPSCHGGGTVRESGGYHDYETVTCKKCQGKGKVRKS